MQWTWFSHPSTRSACTVFGGGFSKKLAARAFFLLQEQALLTSAIAEVELASRDACLLQSSDGKDVSFAITDNSRRALSQ
eukprot:376438-Amphidinium_carterae.1